MIKIMMGVAAAAMLLAACGQKTADNQKVDGPAMSAAAAPGNCRGRHQADHRGGSGPTPGASSYTEDQARAAIEKAGYSELGPLNQNANGLWQGEATKDGKKVSVSIGLQRRDHRALGLGTSFSSKSHHAQDNHHEQDDHPGCSTATPRPSTRSRIWKRVASTTTRSASSPTTRRTGMTVTNMPAPNATARWATATVTAKTMSPRAPARGPPRGVYSGAVRGLLAGLGMLAIPGLGPVVAAGLAGGDGRGRGGWRRRWRGYRRSARRAEGSWPHRRGSQRLCRGGSVAAAPWSASRRMTTKSPRSRKS